MWKMWKRQSAQKWDAIKYFICVIEFRWVIVLRHLNSGSEGRRRIQKKSSTNFFFGTMKTKQVFEPDKKCHAFYGRKTLISCVDHSALLICIFIYCVFHSNHFFLCLVFRCVVAHVLHCTGWWSKVIFFPCSLYFSIIHFVVIFVQFI